MSGLDRRSILSEQDLVVRAMPITCAAICRSPTLLYEDRKGFETWTEAMEIVLERLCGEY